MTTLTFQMQQDGKLPVGIRETLARRLPEFAGKKLRFTFEEAGEKRSLDQNSYLYGVVEPHVRTVRMEGGDPVSLKKVHEDLIEEFAPMIEGTKLDGSKHMRHKRTHEFSVSEMADYITAISARMAEFGNPVPTEKW